MANYTLTYIDEKTEKTPATDVFPIADATANIAEVRND